MRTNSIITAVATATTLFTTGMLAQTEVPAPSAPLAAIGSPASPMPAPNSVIYIPRLPTPAELANAAAAQSLAINKMEVTGNQITVVYKYANGQINTVAYQLLPAAGSAPAMATAPATVVAAPPTTVVYTSGPRDYYYEPYYYGYPWAWPVAFDIGLGYTFHYGGYGHGFHHFGGRGFHRSSLLRA